LLEPHVPIITDIQALHRRVRAPRRQLPGNKVRVVIGNRDENFISAT
jgi:hypothetical protein